MRSHDRAPAMEMACELQSSRYENVDATWPWIEGGAYGEHFMGDEHRNMPEPNPRNLSEIAEIQRQMARIRHEMHQEVQGAVKSARLLTEWRNLVAGHPWICVSLATVAGYMMVPRRPTLATTQRHVAAPTPELLANAGTRSQIDQPARGGWSILGMTFNLLAPVAARAAQNYVLGQLEQWLSQHLVSSSPGVSQRGPRAKTGPSPPATSTNRLRQYG